MEKTEKKKSYLVYGGIGALMLLTAMLFNESDTVSGILTSLSLFAFLMSERLIRERKQFIPFILLLWAGCVGRYFYIIGGVPEYHVGITIIGLLYALLLTAVFAADNFAFRKFRPGFAVSVFPFLYSCFIYLLTVGNIGNIINLVAYLICVPLVEQSISLVGESGMIFTVTLIFSLVSYVLIKREKKTVMISIAAVIIAAMLIFGFIRTRNAKEPDFTLRVATATTRDVYFLATEEDFTKEESMDMLESALKEARDGNADLLVTVEEYLPVQSGQEEWTENRVSELIKKYQIPALICMEYEPAEEKLGANIAVFYDKNGKPVAEYSKHTLVPLIEKSYYEPGDDKPCSFKFKFGDREVNMAYAICFDINNTQFMNMLPNDTELLIIPSWDWDTANLEQRYTYVRSIEHNTTVLKSTMCGFTYVSGPWGLTGQMIDTREESKTVHFVDVPVWLK